MLEHIGTESKNEDNGKCFGINLNAVNVIAFTVELS